MKLAYWQILCIELFCLFFKGFGGSKHVYEFCAENQVFSFSRYECPGGVLLKKPMKLTDPCHCINNHLRIYSACRPPTSENNHTTIEAMKLCRNAGQEDTPVKLLQPSPGASKSKNAGLEDSTCKKIRASCSRLPYNGFNARVHSRAKAFHNIWNLNHSHTSTGSYVHRRKRAVDDETPATLRHITDARLRKRIEETIAYMMELQFPLNGGRGPKIEPKSMSLQVLAKTVKIYNNIAPSIIIEDQTLDSILALFLEKYAKLELPGFSGKLYVDDHISEQSFGEVMAKLNECFSRSSDSSQELEFISDESMCPAEITHVIHRTKGQDFGFKKVKHELGKMMPENRKYIVDAEDFLLGALWKVFDTIYSYCFPYTFSYHNAQILVNYHNIVENIFTSPLVYPDYNAEKGTSMYTTRIEHEDLSVLMKNIDLMDEAVHILSKFKPFFVKPLSELQGQGSSSPSSSSKTPREIKNSKDKRLKRQKRSTTASDNQKLDDIEIWGGRAYCLQTLDPNLPASISNVYPNIDDDMLCI